MRVVDQGTVYDATLAPRPARFATFTTLIRLANGELLAGFRVGSTKDSADEDVYLYASQDEGKSWQQRFGGFGNLHPGSSERTRSIGLTEVAPGKLLASIVTVDRSDASAPLADPETQGLLPTFTYILESSDGGHTWSTPSLVDLAPYRGTTITGDLLQLQDGRIGLPYEAWKDRQDQSFGKHHASLRISGVETTGGANWGAKSWPTLAIVAHDENSRLLFWDQRLTVAPDDGRLFGLFWTHDRQTQADQPIYSAWSIADGEHWSEARSTGIEGQIATPLALGGGRIFMAYVHRHDPPSLRAVISDDFGESWKVDEELVFYEKARGGRESGMGGPRDFGDYWADMSIWTFGHAAATALPNGDVMVAYYAGDADSLGIHWVRIAL